jgi:hypothetical protein
VATQFITQLDTTTTTMLERCATLVAMSDNIRQPGLLHHDGQIKTKLIFE